MYKNALVMDKDKTASAGMRSVGRTLPGPTAKMERAQAGGVSAGQAAQMAIQVC